MSRSTSPCICSAGRTRDKPWESNPGNMNKVHFILGVHNHQPIGNFDFVFEKAYEKSYLPFLEVMERHPAIHWNMHTTGILWEWLEKHRPQYLERVAEQVRQGRLELLPGG